MLVSFVYRAFVSLLRLLICSGRTVHLKTTFWHPSGWYHSGDLAVRHPDGYIELRDRKKDIIVSGGENISTIEVEQAIRGHPAVQPLRAREWEGDERKVG